MSLMVKEMHPIGDNCYKIIKDDSMGSLKKLFEMGYYLYEGKSGIDNTHLFAVLNSIGESIFQFLAGFYSANIANVSLHAHNLEGFLERMHANISNPSFCLASEIEKYGYNVVYFRRIFKENLHMTPTAYFNKMRIDYAKTEFETYGDSRPIKETALASGFNDPYYFDRVFKKITGLSPTEYIQKMKSNAAKGDHSASSSK